MTKNFDFDGLLISVSDENADKKESAECLILNYNVEEIVIPPEVCGVPVEKLSIPLDVTSAGIKRIKIPASVKQIRRVVSCGITRFYNIEIEIDPENPCYCSDGKAIYTKDFGELVFFYAPEDEEYRIQDGCKSVCEKAFMYDYELKRIFFPDSLNSIGGEAFRECLGLTELTLPEGTVKIGNSAFYGCGKIKKITLPSTLESIGSAVFGGNKNVLEIRLPRTLREIGSAFPENFTLVLDPENKYFESCGGSILSKDRKTFICLSEAPADGLAVIPEDVTEIASKAFYENGIIKKAVLPESIQTIGEEAFSQAWNLTEINLENVGKIGSCAFTDCTYLTEAAIDCEKIEHNTFYSCPELRKVILKNTKIISKCAFKGDSRLKEIALPEGLEIIEEEAFSSTGIKTLFIPKTVRVLGKNAADNIKEIHIFDNIESDINADNDLSNYAYTLFVHSAKTGEVKYAVFIFASERDNSHDPIIGMFKGGVSFDFEEFDNYFDSISDNLFDKFKAGMLRLEYGYELDEKTRRKYESQAGKIGRSIVELYFDIDRSGKALNPEFYRYMSLEDLIGLAELSAGKHFTEVTAFLMELCNKKRKEKPDRFEI